MLQLSSKSDLHTRAYKFGLDVIKLTDNLPNKRSAWVITDQVIRSATSVGTNLIEARAATSRLEFKRYNEISLKSANESIYWLSLLEDTSLISKEKIQPIKGECVELSKMLASGIIKLKNTKPFRKF